MEAAPLPDGPIGGRRKLLRGAGSGVARVAEQVDAELVELGTVHLGNAHLELHLLGMDGEDGQRTDHLLGIDRGQLDRLINLPVAGGGAAEINLALLALGVYVLAGQGPLQRLLEVGEVEIGGDGVHRRLPGLVPHHQAAAAGRLGGDHHLYRAGNQRIQH